MSRKSKWRPYLMGGPPTVTLPRSTSADPSDYRIPVVQIDPIRHLAKPRNDIPIALTSPHRIMLRWARSIGDGLPTDEWDELRRSSSLTPLDDVTAIVVDQLVLDSPEHINIVLRLWYKSPLPVSEIAEKLRIDRNQMRQRWLACLSWLRPELKREGVL